ncbi:MAG: tetratricopeptide repeat protein [Acidobacteriota bacterium]
MGGQEDQRAPRTPEEDIAIAREAFGKGERQHALQHLASAVTSDPSRDDWLQLADEILDSDDDPLGLLPVDGTEVYVGTGALHAHALRRLRRPGEALELLLRILGGMPRSPFRAWALAWAVDPDVVASLSREVIVTFMRGAMTAFPGIVREESERAEVRELLPLAELLGARFPSDADIVWCHAGLLRKAGHHERAIAISRSELAREPTWLSAVGLGNALRDAGDLDGARDSLARALELDPADVTAALDIGDIMLEAGRLEESLAGYEKALERQPHHQWAKPSHAYVRWALTRDDTWRKRLDAIANVSGAGERAHVLAEDTWRRTPYLGHLPDPADATVNMMKRIEAEQLPRDAQISLALSSIEAPSSRLALGRLMDNVTVEAEVQQPDPRLATGPTELLLWRYDGVHPSPALAPPSLEQLEPVVSLASTEFQIDVWKSRARSIAATILPPASSTMQPSAGWLRRLFAKPGASSPAGGSLLPARIFDLAALMVHPPPAPHEIPIWRWIFRIQIAVALVMAYVDDGWEGSLRRRALLSLLRGPMDWSVEAAIVALGELARENQTIAPEALRELQRLRAHRPGPGYCCYEKTLLWTMLRMPCVDPMERPVLVAELRAREDPG